MLEKRLIKLSKNKNNSAAIYELTETHKTYQVLNTNLFIRKM